MWVSVPPEALCSGRERGDEYKVFFPGAHRMEWSLCKDVNNFMILLQTLRRANC